MSACGGRGVKFNIEEARVYKPIIVDETSTKLVIGKGISIGIWSRASIDDRDHSGIERIEWGIECVLKVFDFTCVSYVEGWPFERGWKRG